jgi:protoporphyrin/coproporphyrin ferrochelatase
LRNGKNGVILLNMGGPDTLDNVRPFLFNLFSDREIIKLGPAFLQKFLAWIISRRRAPKSRAIYSKIGGGSPLKEISFRQAKALQSALDKDGDYIVTVAMRYWPPYADEAIQELLAAGADHLTALTLYPHYSKATTGSSMSQLQKSLQRLAPNLPLTTIASWPTQNYYVAALAENIIKGLRIFKAESVQIVYSAHSLPVSFIKEGDPYVEHIKQTITAIEKITEQRGRLCYQSRSGPVEWLSPSTPEMLEILAEEGCKNILMVPISFVSDHVETLYEINILYREQAAGLGMCLQPCPSLNTNPVFIQGLRALVLQEKR